MTDAALFSSASSEWKTPDELYQRYNDRWEFTLDAAATHENAKAPMYCTAEGTYLKADYERWRDQPMGEQPDGNVHGKSAEPPQHHTADGLHFGWWTAAGGLLSSPRARIWVNPPYGRGDAGAGPWVALGRRQAEVYGSLVQMLLPARTDTRWFHDDVIGKAKIEFLRGRVHFERTYDCCAHGDDVHNPGIGTQIVCHGCDGDAHTYHRAGDSDAAPFPSMVATWGA